MTSTITHDGIYIDPLSDILENLKRGFTNIYGSDVTFEQDSPDGQMLNIFALAVRDTLEFCREIYNSFDPDQAVGRSLDQRVAYNGLIRKGGSYSVVQLDVVVDSSCRLYGLDTVAKESLAFTVGDSVGNNYYLLESRALTAGTYQLNFRAVEQGQVESNINTINLPKTYVRGVVSVNNPRVPILIGKEEESDPALRLRRNKAVGYSIMGQLETMQASLLALEHVSDVVIDNNRTSTTNSKGTPAHSVWVIVEGGDSKNIAAHIYLRLGGGCGMKGSVTEYVETIYGNIQEIKFDRPLDTPIAIKITAEPRKVTSAMVESEFKEALINKWLFQISSPAATSDLGCTCKSINNDYAYYNIQVARKDKAYGKTTTAAINAALFTSVTDGKITVILNRDYNGVGGTTYTVTGMNFSSVLSTANVASVIDTAFTAANVPITVSFSNNNLIFKADATSVNASIYFDATAGDGTDIISATFINPDTCQYSFEINSTDWDSYMPTNTIQEKFSVNVNDIFLNKLS